MTAPARRVYPPDDLLTIYLREISAVPLIDRDEEAALAKRVRAGDAAAVDILVRANLRFVVSVAKKYQHRGVSLIDLINDGNVGLLRAAYRFDERRGVRFISYAVWWIRQALLQAIADQGCLVRIPIQHAGTVARLERRARRLEQELGRAPTHDELTRGADGSDATVAPTLVQSYLSLDAPLGEEPERDLFEVTADRRAPSADDVVIAGALGDTIAAALAILPIRDATILRLYFGFGDCDALTLEAIGERFGITRERVRQLKERALQKVRRGRHGRALASFAE